MQARLPRREKTSASALSSASESLEKASPSEFRIVEHPARSGTRACARRVPRGVDAARRTEKGGPRTEEFPLQARAALVQNTGQRQVETGNRFTRSSAWY